jgi:hypothetical protein
MNALDMETRISQMEKMIWELNNQDLLISNNLANETDALKIQDANLSVRVTNLENQVKNLYKDMNAVFNAICILDNRRNTPICNGSYIRPTYTPIVFNPNGQGDTIDRNGV